MSYLYSARKIFRYTNAQKDDILSTPNRVTGDSEPRFPRNVLYAVRRRKSAQTRKNYIRQTSPEFNDFFSFFYFISFSFLWWRRLTRSLGVRVCDRKETRGGEKKRKGKSEKRIIK